MNYTHMVVKAVCLFLAYTFITPIGRLISDLAMHGSGTNFGDKSIASFIMFGAGVFIFLFADKISMRLLRAAEIAEGPSGKSLSAAYALPAVMVGLVSLTKVFVPLMRYYFSGQWSSEIYPIYYIIIFYLPILVSIYLIAGAPGITEWQVKRTLCFYKNPEATK